MIYVPSAQIWFTKGIQQTLVVPYFFQSYIMYYFLNRNLILSQSCYPFLVRVHIGQQNEVRPILIKKGLSASLHKYALIYYIIIW